jgi:hypothetical protein
VSELLTKIDTKTTVNQWWIKFRDGINKIIEDNVLSLQENNKIKRILNNIFFCFVFHQVGPISVE